MLTVRSVLPLLRPAPARPISAATTLPFSFSSSGSSFVLLPRPRCTASISSSVSSVSVPPQPPRPWSGLQAWRAAPPNDDRIWGPRGPTSSAPEETVAADDGDRASSLAEFGALVLSTADPLAKSRLSHLAFSRWLRDVLPVGTAAPPYLPARPDNPPLVPTKEVPTPKSSGFPLNAYMLHNLAHVELNAMDLAWDTVVRFSPLREELGDQFFADFARVADDESRHFAWCSQRLNELGFSYGDMPAHNMLWKECAKSSGDVSARLVVIPLVQVF